MHRLLRLRFDRSPRGRFLCLQHQDCQLPVHDDLLASRPSRGQERHAFEDTAAPEVCEGSDLTTVNLDDSRRAGMMVVESNSRSCGEELRQRQRRQRPAVHSTNARRSRLDPSPFRMRTIDVVDKRKMGARPQFQSSTSLKALLVELELPPESLYISHNG